MFGGYSVTDFQCSQELSASFFQKIFAPEDLEKNRFFSSPRAGKSQTNRVSEMTQKIKVGMVENTVEFASFKLSLSGGTKFIDKKNILAFDFTKITVKLFGIKLYSGYIRDGKESENKFLTESVAKQAFFTYFLIQEKFIAARGRGGGLAIWKKLENLELSE